MPIRLVSACLAGLGCRYDGHSCSDGEVVAWVRAGQAIPICPEQLGGLTTPREPAYFVGGTGEEVLDGRARLIVPSGSDVTEAFLRGARETLRFCRLLGLQEAMLKSRSPSCGLSQVHGGEGQSSLVVGKGVTAALLLRAGLRLSERDGEAGQ